MAIIFIACFKNLPSFMICNFSQRYDVSKRSFSFLFLVLNHSPQGKPALARSHFNGQLCFWDNNCFAPPPLYKPSQNELLISNGFTATFLRERTLYFWVHGLSFSPLLDTNPLASVFRSGETPTK